MIKNNIDYIWLVLAASGILILSNHVIDTYFHNDVYEIRTCQDLQGMNKDLDATYILMNDLDCKDYRYE